MRPFNTLQQHVALAMEQPPYLRRRNAARMQTGILCLIVLGLVLVCILLIHDAAFLSKTHVAPQLGLWLVVFAVGSIVIRRSLLADSTLPRTLTGLFMASVRVVLPAMVFLVFLGGVASSLGETLSRWLRDFSAGYSALFCRTFLSEDYVRQGYHIYLPDASGGGIRAAIEVTTECGGYRSFLGMVLLALLFCSDPRVTLRRKFILACSSLALALGGNMVRLSISAMLNHCGQEHLVSGVFHPALGQMLIGIEAVLLYVLWRRLMRNVVEPVPEVNVETRVIQ